MLIGACPLFHGTFPGFLVGMIVNLSIVARMGMIVRAVLFRMRMVVNMNIAVV